MIFFMCSAIWIAAALHEALCNYVDSDKIMGGELAMPGQYPFIVSLQVYTANGFTHGCAGSIIGKSHILTAGHCLQGMSPVHLMVLAGTVELDEENIHPYRGQFYKVTKITVHEDFGRYGHDIGIIEIQGEIGSGCDVFEENKPAQIGMKMSETKEGTNCVVLGWGFQSTPFAYENPKMPNTLSYANVPIYNRQTCLQCYMDNGISRVKNGTICAGYEDGGKSSCYGDSGGPLVCDGSLTGIVSFGSMICGEKQKPGVYTEVFQFADWISKHGCTLCSKS